MPDAILSLHDVDACYGRAQVLFGVSLAVAAGEAVALMGRNGAGKSTTLKTVIGQVRPRGGAVRLEARDITRAATHDIIRAGLGYVPEDRRLFGDLTVAENLEVGRQPPRPGLQPWSDQRLFALFPKLRAMLGRRAGTLSGGEQQMLSIARTLLGNPRLLLLDEPSEGLAPVVVDDLAAALAEIKRQGVAILLSEQNLSLAGRVGDRAYVIEKGHIRHQAAMAALLADAVALHQWLGV